MRELGEELQRARTALGLSLQDVQERTRIRAQYLQALERGEVESLPGEVYVRGFLRSYAQCVGLDSGRVLGRYDELRGHARPAAAPLSERTPRVFRPLVASALPANTASARSRMRRARWAAALVVLATGAVGVWAWFSREAPGFLPSPSRLASDGSGGAAEPGAPPPAAGEGVEEDRVAAVPPAQDPAGAADSARERGPGGPALPATASVAAGGGPTPRPGQSASLPASFPRAGAAAGVVVTARVLEPCWVDVYVDGVQVLTRTLQPGEEITWQGRDLIQIKFGYPQGVELTHNGVPLGRAGTAVVTRTFTREAAGGPGSGGGLR